MKKKSIFILLFISSSIMSQSWESDKNRFGMPNEELYKKNENATKQDISYIKYSIDKAGVFYDYFNQNKVETQSNSGDQQSFSSGPGAPGEPLPIDKYEALLFLIGLIVIMSNKKIRRKYIKKADSCQL